jgi:hypothetical protein
VTALYRLTATAGGALELTDSSGRTLCAAVPTHTRLPTTAISASVYGAHVVIVQRAAWRGFGLHFDQCI